MLRDGLKGHFQLPSNNPNCHHVEWSFGLSDDLCTEHFMSAMDHVLITVKV